MSCYFQRNSILRFEKAGPFRIQEIIGAGASSVVYRAINTEDRTEHLLKEFHPNNLPLKRDSVGNLVLHGGERERRYFAFRLEQFKLGYRKQIELRKDPVLKNRTSNVQGIYSGYGTLWVDMTVFDGVSYDKVTEKSFADLVKRIRAITEVISRYHDLGYLHLDIKPENIFTLTENCESVMFFDFDTVIAKAELKPGIVLGKTKGYAAPELADPDAFRLIGEWTDIYAIGVMFFQKIFGRFPDSHEQESGSNYDFRVPSGILNNTNDKVLELLTDFFRHTICRSKRFRWKSTDEMLRVLNQILKAMLPVSKQVQENEDIRNVSKQISKLSKAILISAILIALSIGFMAFRRTGSDTPYIAVPQKSNSGQQIVQPQQQTIPFFSESSPVVAETTANDIQQSDAVIVTNAPETLPAEEITPTATATHSMQNVTAGYVVETIANDLDAFRSMVITNSGDIYYLDGSILHATNTSDTLDLLTDFTSPLENGHLAYDPYQDTVYLLAGGSLSIYDITNFSEPILKLNPEGFMLHPSTGIAPVIAVLPDHSLIIPASYDGSRRLSLETGKHSAFTKIHILQSPYFAVLAGENIYMFREGETEASIIPILGSEERSITLEMAAPWNEAAASSGSRVLFYSDGVGVCEYESDGSASVRIAQQDISITDYQSLDYNNIWAVAANESGDFAFYDNSLSSIRYIHSPK